MSARRTRSPIPLSIRTCGSPASGLPLVFFAWLRCLLGGLGVSAPRRIPRPSPGSPNPPRPRISPLLANIYLHTLDRTWAERGQGKLVRTRLQPSARTSLLQIRSYRAWKRRSGDRLAATYVQLQNPNTPFDERLPDAFQRLRRTARLASTTVRALAPSKEALDVPLSLRVQPAGACYRALGRLPGRDSHPLAWSSFQDATSPDPTASTPRLRRLPTLALPYWPPSSMGGSA